MKNLIFPLLAASWPFQAFPKTGTPVKLAASPEGILYFNYSKNYLQYMAAIQPDGQLLWETPFDQSVGIHEFYIGNLSVTENGDIVGTGTVLSAVHQLGWS